MKWDPLNITCWKHEWGFHNRGVTWDTPIGQMGRIRGRLDTEEVENESSQEDRSGSCNGTGNSFVAVTDQNDRRRRSS